MKHIEVGDPKGNWVVYFHGAPGAPGECQIFDVPARRFGIRLLCLDRFSVDPSIAGDWYYEVLADEISRITRGEPVDFIGFSIGAFVALQTSRFMRSSIHRIHLVSAAAPLEAGDFLESMAGKRVFQLARSFPGLFSVLSYVQSLLALFRPAALFQMLFAGAAGADEVLAKNHEFRLSIANALTSCFANGIRGYLREIKAYVLPWQAALADVSAETSIWHGSQDNWSPPAMAFELESKIPKGRIAEMMDGLSHYSCLYESAPLICEVLASTWSAKSLQTAGVFPTTRN